MQFIWKKHHQSGYEVSTAGDARFSAFNARLQDGRSIECHYQCDVKGYDPGGTNWRRGKGLPPVDLSTQLWPAYLGLWVQWAMRHSSALRELRQAAPGGVLTDRFASTPVNQANALCTILNKLDTGVAPDCLDLFL